MQKFLSIGLKFVKKVHESDPVAASAPLCRTTIFFECQIQIMDWKSISFSNNLFCFFSNEKEMIEPKISDPRHPNMQF